MIDDRIPAHADRFVLVNAGRQDLDLSFLIARLREDNAALRALYSGLDISTPSSVHRKRADRLSRPCCAAIDTASAQP